MGDAAAGAGRTRGRRATLVLAAAGVLLLHSVLLCYFIDLRTVFADVPMQGDDFDIHIGQTFRVIDGLARWGHSWVYDVQLLAGQPEGTIFDADNKGWELWTYALTRLGVSRAVAFNSFVLLGPLLCPLALLLAARAFGLRVWSSVLCAAMASVFWFFDSFSHWVWWVGMGAYGLASFLCVLPLALFHGYCQQPRMWQAAACALLVGALHVVHPYTFFMLAVPMAALYLRARPRFGAREHLGVLAIIGVTLAMNAYWLLNAARHWHYVLNSAYFGQTGFSYLVADFFSLLRNPSDTGVIGTRTGFRFLYLAMALAGLVLWSRARDTRFLPFASALGVLLVLAYFGAYVPGASQLQPYRHVLPAGFVAIIPAAYALQWAVEHGGFAAMNGTGRAAFAIAALIGLQHLARDVLYFMPSLVPPPPPLIDGTPSPITAYGYLSHFFPTQHISYRLPREVLVDAGMDDVVDWVQHNLRPGQRVLVDKAVLGERIAWKTGVEVLGGFRERNVAHARANFFRRFGDAAVSHDVLRQYLRTFAVSWVISHIPRSDFEAARDLLDAPLHVAGRYVYRTRIPVSMFQQGRGTLRAATNRIELRTTPTDQDLVLSYHWHEALVCAPGCRVERAQAPLDDIGFIRVPAPHAPDLVIENGYR
jgi:hypothetical protein